MGSWSLQHQPLIMLGTSIKLQKRDNNLTRKGRNMKTAKINLRGCTSNFTRSLRTSRFSSKLILKLELWRQQLVTTPRWCLTQTQTLTYLLVLTKPIISSTQIIFSLWVSHLPLPDLRIRIKLSKRALNNLINLLKSLKLPLPSKLTQYKKKPRKHLRLT